MVTISLCMIVKNEEAVLARCLDGLVDLMDEIIIVDTGSTDNTKAIAKRYTDKLYDFEWTGDFSEARNFSFSKATKEYVYVADADEVVDEVNRERFKHLKQAMLDEVEIVQMYYCNQLQYGTTYNFDKEYRPKLYKRKREFQWIEPIHEIVRTDPVVFDSDVEILHLPQGNHAKRDFQTFLRIQKEKRRLSKHLHRMYAMELYISGDHKDFLEAKETFLKSSKEPNRSEQEYKEAYIILARIARLEGNLSDFFQNALKEVASNPSSELCYELGEYFFDKKDYQEAVVWYYNAAFEAESVLNIKYLNEYPIKALIECYKNLNQEEWVKHYQKLLDQRSSN